MTSYQIFAIIMGMVFIALIPRIFSVALEIAQWAIEGWVELVEFIRDLFRKDA